MRKGEKLYKVLFDKAHDNIINSGKFDYEKYTTYDILNEMFDVLENISDEEFIKIIYDVENIENWVEGYEIGKGT